MSPTRLFLTLALALSANTGCHTHKHNSATRPDTSQKNGAMGVAVQSYEQLNLAKLKLATGAMLAYLTSHHNRFPGADHWEEAIKPYWESRSAFDMSLSVSRGQPPHRLAMNRRLSLTYVDDSYHTANTIMFYETASREKDAHGNPDEEPVLHLSGSYRPMIMYVDGHLPD